MAKKNIVPEIEEEGNLVVEMTDEEGNVYLYQEEMIIPVDDKKFALLVALPDEEHECHCNHNHEHEHDHECECGCHHNHEHEHECDCGCGEDDVIIAKIVVNDDGEEEYVEPTDEEFEVVSKAYNDFFSEDVAEI